MLEKFKINELSQKSGVHLETIRYYEKLGLISQAKRQANGYRVFDETHLAELSFIKACRAMNLSLDECKMLLDIQKNPTNSCESVDELAKKHLNAINEQIAQLQLIKTLLENMVGCQNNDVAHCQIIQNIKELG
ncbi:MerR family transcriptional regulator [Mannheimia bovis]|uniref:MerR family transcriptional regulator n=1 Tax=Mannheimia bovis TaxID=2770636 RepID=A0A7H1C0J5_9PAST|nr:MerR family transcriptional regulator [Mannheimia bovis]QNS14500.1 MerR family transcriptional regulator [Mannheimia bovis]